MSDSAVVAAFRARLESGLVGIPYVQTLNNRPASLPDTYVSLERDYCDVERITLGTPTQFRETGSLNVVIAKRAGTGYLDSETLGSQVRDLFHNYSLVHLQVLTVGSTQLAFEPDEGNFFQMKVSVRYIYDFFK